MTSPASFIADGPTLAREALAPQLQAKIAAAYAPQLAAASWPRRLWLRWQMRRELAMQLERRAPAEALY
ncbi:hypothetical protein [Lacipirellula sp.]|uniref:hypothetical protein n=1 Tax=Lacipirellula sp. TaxID=2691419 RepID=UPI003D113877